MSGVSASGTRVAGPDDLAPGAETLAAAFREYPWTRHVIPDDDFDARLRELQHLYLGYAHEQGFVAVTPHRDGVLALVRPGADAPAPSLISRVVELHGDRVDRLDTAESPAGAWRLETLGVHPRSQGRGIASELLRFALAEVARRGGGAVALDTSDVRNVRLYERHGFRTTAHEPADGSPPVWRMTAHVVPASSRHDGSALGSVAPGGDLC